MFVTKPKLSCGTVAIWSPGVTGLPKNVYVRIMGVCGELPVTGHRYIVEVLDGTLPNEQYPYVAVIAEESSLLTEKIF